jgi:transcriptional regulator with XRE-family HTH domain
MAGLSDNNNPINLIEGDTDMPDDRTARQAMAEMGITVEDVARASGVDPSYASKQLRGHRPLQGAVKTAFVEALDEKAVAALPDACERLWERLNSPGDDSPS